MHFSRLLALHRPRAGATLCPHEKTLLPFGFRKYPQSGSAINPHILNETSEERTGKGSVSSGLIGGHRMVPSSHFESEYFHPRNST